MQNDYKEMQNNTRHKMLHDYNTFLDSYQENQEMHNDHTAKCNYKKNIKDAKQPNI